MERFEARLPPRRFLDAELMQFFGQKPHLFENFYWTTGFTTLSWILGTLCS